MQNFRSLLIDDRDWLTFFKNSFAAFWFPFQCPRNFISKTFWLCTSFQFCANASLFLFCPFTSILRIIFAIDIMCLASFAAQTIIVHLAFSIKLFCLRNIIPFSFVRIAVFAFFYHREHKILKAKLLNSGMKRATIFNSMRLVFSFTAFKIIGLPDISMIVDFINSLVNIYYCISSFLICLCDSSARCCLCKVFTVSTALESCTPLLLAFFRFYMSYIVNPYKDTYRRF